MDEPYHAGVWEPISGVAFSIVLTLVGVFLGGNFGLVLIVILFEIVVGALYGITDEISGGLYILGIATTLYFAGHFIAILTQEPIIGAYIAIVGTICGMVLKNSSELGTAFSYIIGILLIIVLALGVWFIYVDGQNVAALNAILHPTTTTSVSTTSTIPTTTSTSSSTTTTTTIPPYTNCLVERGVEAFIPLNCSSPALASRNSISFSFGLSRNATTIYNINLACTVSLQHPPGSLFYPLESYGTPDLNRITNGTSLAGGHIINVKNWPCDANSINGSFSGYIWVNYTRAQGPAVQLNPLESNLTFNVYVDYILTSAAYNQTKNLTT